MRLLIRTRNLAWRGGIETYLGAILPALLKEGVELVLAYEEGARLEETRIDRDAPGIALLHIEDRASALEQIAAWRPDVVMENGAFDWELGRSLARAYPAVSFVHVHTGTCISGSKLRSRPTPVPCERVLGPACLALYLPCRCGGMNPIVGVRLYRLAQRKQRELRAYRKIFVGSEWMKADLIRHGFASSGITVLSYFPDGGTLPALPSPPKTRGTILMLSRMTKLKGGDVLLRAIPGASLKLGRPLKIVVAGNGPTLPALKERASQLQIDAVFEDASPLPVARRQELMRGAELLALPSLWPEPFGLVGLEAGAVGLPSVAFASGGPLDWCLPGETGELAPANPPTADGLADAIVRALGDPSHYQKLRAGAFALAQRLSLAAHVKTLVAELRDVAATRRP